MISHIRLNLFLVFNAIMQTGSVSEAAKRLKMKRDAVQHALGHLRIAMDDELFVFQGGTMRPTRLATELNENVAIVSEALARFATTLKTKEFVPEKALRGFRVAAGDYFTDTVLPPLYARINDAAPRVRIEIFPCSRLDIISQLEDGHVDFAVGWFGKLPDRFNRRVVLTDEETLVVRPGHPLLEGAVTTDRILSFPRVVVDISGDEEVSRDGYHHEKGVLRRVWMDRFLIDATPGEEGKIGHVAVSVPYFGSVAPLVAASDLVGTLPRRLAEVEVKRGTIAIVTPPYPPLQVGVQAIYCKDQDNDEGLKWLFEQIAAVCEEMG